MNHKPCPYSVEDSFYLIAGNAIFKISPPIRNKSLLEKFLDFCIVSMRRISLIDYWFVEFEKSKYLAFFKNEENINYLRGYYLNPERGSFNAYWKELGSSYLPYIHSGNWAWTKEGAINKIRLRYAIEKIKRFSDCLSLVEICDKYTPIFEDAIDFQICYIVYDLNTSSLKLEPEENVNDYHNVFPSDFGYIINEERGLELIRGNPKELIHILCYWIDYSIYNFDVENITVNKHRAFPYYEYTYCVNGSGIYEIDQHDSNKDNLIIELDLGLCASNESDAQDKYDRMYAIEKVRQYLITNNMLCKDIGDPNVAKYMFKLERDVSGKRTLAIVYTTDILRYSPYGYVNSKRNMDKFLADHEELLVKIHYYDIEYKHSQIPTYLSRDRIIVDSTNDPF